MIEELNNIFMEVKDAEPEYENLFFRICQYHV